MTGMLIAGTSSDAGKSLVTTGLCRVARRRGIKVAPFKAQNMSNNSMVVADGEIGRAQWLQALAAGVTPSTLLNPVLLKPGSDRQSFVVLRGQPAGLLRSGEYATGRTHLREAAWEAYEELRDTHDLVICEGAGSPAEINLREGDYTNMGLARQFGLPVVLVGDIDRGGVLASIFGTHGLLDAADRALLAGYVINKFRGDQAILEPGLVTLSERTGLTNFGVLPYLPGMWIDREDTLQVGQFGPPERADDLLRVAAIRFPRVSNATDIDALAHEPGVHVAVTQHPGDIAAADVVVLPGSRATVADLTWMHEQGLADAVLRHVAAGKPVLGICGGMQMLGKQIQDSVETKTDAEGLGLLPFNTHFHSNKVLGTPSGVWRGHAVSGYEIHHGRPRIGAQADEFPGGLRNGNVWATMWHGTMESDDFRRAWLQEAAAQAGSSWKPRPGEGFAAAREQMIDTMADAIEECLDVDALLRF